MHHRFTTPLFLLALFLIAPLHAEHTEGNTLSNKFSNVYKRYCALPLQYRILIPAIAVGTCFCIYKYLMQNATNANQLVGQVTVHPYTVSKTRARAECIYQKDPALHPSAEPIITRIEWGKITILHNDQEKTYKDAKLEPKGANSWNWKTTGTKHTPGIQVADIQDLVDHVDIVLLTQGMDLVLEVPHETIQYATDLGKEVHVGQTRDMVLLYNDLIAQNKRVGGVFHSTC